jgi:hypothetical protein
MKFIPIRIHVWGGFGSQLFGYIVAERLKQKFPRRGLKYLFHTSGVTRRELELPALLLKGTKVVRIDDFEDRTSLSKGEVTSVRPGYRLNIISKLVRFGFLARLNSQSEFNRLRNFVFEVRGHYSNIEFTSEELVSLHKRIQTSEKAPGTSTVATLHYRLGDLLTLQEKGPISTTRIASVINSLNEIFELQVFSDSPEEALDRLRQFTNPNKPIQAVRANSLEVISRCCQSKVFIGTNSKLSIWIALFKATSVEESKIYMPEESIPQLKINLPEIQSVGRIFAY